MQNKESVVQYEYLLPRLIRWTKGGEDVRDDRFWIGLSLLALGLLGILGYFVLTRSAPTAALTAGRPVVVIDPGHGGEDGGAVAPDGTEEADINLAVARRLDLLLRFLGRDTLLLRESDVSLHDPSASTIREKKVSDIHNRVDTVNAQTDPHLISIHQNFFPSSKYHGAQVFYGGNPVSQPWAEVTRGNLRSCLAPDNKREAKPIDRGIYLMNHVSCPALLIECGFLSNPEERCLLKDGDYQTALAVVIAGSYIQSTQEKGETVHVSQGEESVLLHPMRE